MVASHGKPTCLHFSCCGVASSSRATLILAEVLQGFRQKRDMDKARQALLSLAYADLVG
jgi:hypothetical protein